MAEPVTVITSCVALTTAVVVLVDRVFDIRRQAKDHEAQLAAKDETIKVLKERLDAQKDLTPPRLREYLDAITAIMEKHGATLTQELDAARNQIAELEALIGASERLTRDPELLRLTRDTIAHLAAAERDSHVWRWFISQTMGDQFEGLTARSEADLAASPQPVPEDSKRGAEEGDETERERGVEE